MADLVDAIILIAVGVVFLVLARWVGSQISGQPGRLVRTVMVIIGVICVIVGIILLLVALIEGAAGPGGHPGAVLSLVWDLPQRVQLGQ